MEPWPKIKMRNLRNRQRHLTHAAVRLESATTR